MTTVSTPVLTKYSTITRKVSSLPPRSSNWQIHADLNADHTSSASVYTDITPNFTIKLDRYVQLFENNLGKTVPTSNESVNYKTAYLRSTGISVSSILSANKGEP